MNKGASRDRCMAANNTCVFTHNLFTEKATEFLTNQSAQANPFFLYLTYTIPHAGGWYKDQETGAPVPSDGPYVDKNWPNVEKDHAAAITSFEDRDIGNILKLLDRLNLSDNTVVFFSSDNGAHNEGGHNYLFFNSSGPLRGFKRSLYEGGIRTPMIVRWPNRIASGVKSNFVWSFWDFLPTAAEFAGIDSKNLPPNLDGVSVVPTLLGTQQPAKPYLYWEFCTNNKWGHAVRMGKWKAVSFAVDEPFELYDLSNDIGETNNVAGTNPHIIVQMNDIAKKEHTNDPNWPIVNCVSS